ncbi:hypothetical protein QOT17_003136 [Balamuthia mandrillaris]
MLWTSGDQFRIPNFDDVVGIPTPMRYRNVFSFFLGVWFSFLLYLVMNNAIRGIPADASSSASGTPTVRDASWFDLTTFLYKQESVRVSGEWMDPYYHSKTNVLPRLGCMDEHLLLARATAAATPPTEQDLHFFSKAVRDSRRWTVYIMFQFNFHMFLQSFTSLLHNGFSGRITVIDNSHNCTASNHPFVLRHSRLLQTHTRLTFSQMQELMVMDAQRQRMPFYFWTHADVVHLGRSRLEPSFGEGVLRVFDSLTDRGRHESWATVFFAYDNFAAYRTAAVLHIPPDVGIPHYPADCDWYHRLELAGYELLVADSAGFVYDMHGVVEGGLPWGDYEATEEVLQRHLENPEGTNRNEWRRVGVDKATGMALEYQRKYGRKYFKDKFPLWQVIPFAEPWQTKNQTSVTLTKPDNMKQVYTTPNGKLLRIETSYWRKGTGCLPQELREKQEKTEQEKEEKTTPPEPEQRVLLVDKGITDRWVQKTRPSVKEDGQSAKGEAVEARGRPSPRRSRGGTNTKAQEVLRIRSKR